MQSILRAERLNASSSWPELVYLPLLEVSSFWLSGINHDSGLTRYPAVPDFRSPKTGLYNNLARLDLPYAEAVFEIDYFRKHPEPFYVLAKELYPGKFQPTVSHAFLALLAQKGLLQMLFTQNIDCLERAAGVPADKIIEAHGSFATQRCIDCQKEYPDKEMEEHVQRGDVPRCSNSSCNGLVKPDIVFFGEALPRHFRENTFQASMADLALVIGTSLQVYPFAGLPQSVMESKPRVLFNMERVGQMGGRADDVLVLGPADDGIRRLADELGWRDELEKMWRDVVGDEEADRQISCAKHHEKDMEEEVNKLTEDVEDVLKLNDEHDAAEPLDDGDKRDSEEHRTLSDVMRNQADKKGSDEPKTTEDRPESQLKGKSDEDNILRATEVHQEAAKVPADSSDGGKPAPEETPRQDSTDSGKETRL